MFVIVFLQGFVFYGPVATLFRQARGLSMSEIFLIESISWILMIVLEVPWGWFADKFGYKKTLVVANSLFFISKIVFFMSHSFSIFLLERVLLSFVFAGLSGCDEALIYSSIDENDAQKVFGRYSAVGTLGFLIASVLSSFVISVSMDFSAFLTMFPYGLAVVLTLFLSEVNTENHYKPKFMDSVKQAFSDKSIIIFVVAIALIVEVFQAVTIFLNQSQYLKSGIDPKYFGFILAGIQLVNLFSVKSDSLTTKLGNSKAIISLVTLILLSCGVLAFTANPIVSIVMVLGISLSMAMIGPIGSDIQNKTIKTADRATILSIYSMAGSLIASIGNVIIGQTADISLEVGLVTCLMMSVAALALMVIYFKVNGKRNCVNSSDSEKMVA